MDPARRAGEGGAAAKYCFSLRWMARGVSLGDSTSAAISGMMEITLAPSISAWRLPRITATSGKRRVDGDNAYSFPDSSTSPIS